MCRKHHFFFLLVIVLMGSVSMLSTDIHLPALPEMCEHFNCSQVQMQSSFVLFLLGLAACQLVYGNLADRFGRKRITLLAISLFIVASYLCARSSTLTEFLIFRTLQSIGAGVGSVINRAVIADRFNKMEAAKIFSTVFPIIGLSAAIGPLIGGYLCGYLGWRAIFYFMMGYGILVWVLVIFYLEENKKQKEEFNRAQHQHPIRRLFSAYYHLLSNWTFLGYSLVLCAGFAAFRSYAVESPFVFDSQGFDAKEMGTFYIAISAAYLIGNVSAKWLLNRIALERVINIGFCFFVLGGLSMLALSYYFGQSPYAIIIPMGIVVLGNGFLFPMSSAGAMTSIPTLYSGRASGLLGALQFVFAAICINWVGEFSRGRAFYLALFIVAIILLGLFAYRFLAERKEASVVIVKEN